MYKIVGLTDLDGVSKDERLRYIEEKYSLYGSFFYDCFYRLQKGFSFGFVYDGDSDKMLKSSTIKDVDYVEKDKLYIITTRNSIYYIKEVDNEDIER